MKRCFLVIWFDISGQEEEEEEEEEEEVFLFIWFDISLVIWFDISGGWSKGVYAAS
jgi:hypothetical protein